MKTGRLQAFSYCPSCADIRAVRGAIISYFADATQIQGACTNCGATVNIVGKRHPGPRIGKDKRRLN